MPLIKIKDVNPLTHLQCAVFRIIDPSVAVTTQNERVRLEVYAGSIKLGMQNDMAPTTREEYKTYLPLIGNKIRFYSSLQSLIPDNYAVMVSPSGFTGFADQRNTLYVEPSVGFVDLKMENHFIDKPCLVLNFTLGLLNGVFHRVAYNVTVLTTEGQVTDKDIGPDEVPG